jgi:hypothetical protein
MELVFIYILYVVVGALAGVLGGLLGIGGGVVTVPCFLYMFRFLDFPQPFVMHMAIATSLAAMIFNTFSSTWAHHRRHNVLWKVFLRFVPGLIIGAILAAYIANLLPGRALEISFGVFLCAMAVRFCLQKSISDAAHKLPGPLVLTGLGGLIGLISNMLGIGGGSLAVPLLTSFKIRDKNAIGTSSAVTLVTATLGTVSYLFLGMKELPKASLGFIDPTAFLIVGISACFTAPIGVHLVHILDPQKVRRIFSLVLVLTGLSLIF